MLLTIENVTTAKTGKSLRVKANGEWYGANLKSGLQNVKGQIDAEVEEGEYGKWIQAYKPIASEAHREAAAAAPKANGGSGAAPWWMPFVSNTVAHAIAAGLCPNPTVINAWAKAAKEAAEALDT